MGKLNCECGWQISDVASPSREKGWMLSDEQLDEQDTYEAHEIIDKARDVWECSQCGRIAFGNPEDNKVKWYAPINGLPGHMNNFSA